MSTTVQNKIKQLKAYRQNYIERIVDIKVIADTARTDASLVPQFKARFTHLEQIYQEFEKLTKELVPLTLTIEDYNVDEERQVRQEFYENFYSIKANFSEFCGLETDPEFVSARTKINAKLPKIELIKFKEGPPLALVKRHQISAANYTAAYDALTKKYEDKRLIASTHYHALVNASKIPENKVNHLNLSALVGTYSENLADLSNLGFQMKGWDFILFNMLLDRLDSDTASKFESNYASNNEIPSFDDLLKFLQERCVTLKRLNHQQTSSKSNTNSPDSSRHNASSSYPKKSFTSFFAQNKGSGSCPLCKSNHLIYKCAQFTHLSPKDRYNLAKSRKWCINCLGSKHLVKDCGSSSRCFKCNQAHHTLLHFVDSATASTSNITPPPQDSTSSPSTTPPSNLDYADSSSRATTSLSCSLSSKTTVLLSTALIKVLDSQGNYRTLRALLDSGSQVNIVTENCCHTLGLSRRNISLAIQGLGHMNATVSKAVNFVARPCDSLEPKFTVEAIVLPQICGTFMPRTPLATQKWSHISNLKLADPKFNIPSNIDVLLGAEIFSLALNSGRIVGNKDEPIAVDTVFGWILMGNVSCHLSIAPVNSFCCLSESSLNDSLKRLWEIEDVPREHSSSPDDLRCEDLFSQTYFLYPFGRKNRHLPTPVSSLLGTA
ncbi:hypothetical protein NQ315_017552 [Exocentrus adspersus]|uniref:Peptidase aspartic putative domain-containing protein n=1 Tax=Exocentrus adspersus TaxID=1586481 RepID=A0AAV8VIN1_9CUCU|nr:hypothetical protein NQ315_017552 [Exocentrus adspersus]